MISGQRRADAHVLFGGEADGPRSDDSKLRRNSGEVRRVALLISPTRRTYQDESSSTSNHFSHFQGHRKGAVDRCAQTCATRAIRRETEEGRNGAVNESI